MSFRDFKKVADSRLRLGFFMFMKLPSAYFCGVRLRSITEEEAIVSVPFKWLSQNPFRSIYFACQAMAAEMSTGMLAMGHLYKLNPPVSMLVTRLEARFIKKATERVYFTCTDGAAMREAIARAVATGEGQTFEAHSVGRTANGEVVSEFRIEWSFKARSSKG